MQNENIAETEYENKKSRPQKIAVLTGLWDKDMSRVPNNPEPIG